MERENLKETKTIINELRKLYNDIDSCISDLVVARGRRDDNGIAAAHWQMETLMVNTQQTISYILENLEVKEVDLEKEIETHLKECLDVKFPTTDIELIKKDVRYTAEMFFELGLKAQKGE